MHLQYLFPHQIKSAHKKLASHFQKPVKNNYNHWLHLFTPIRYFFLKEEVTWQLEKKQSIANNLNYHTEVSIHVRVL